MADEPKTDSVPKMELQYARVLLYPGHDVEVKACTPCEYFVLTKLHAEGAKTAEPVTLPKGPVLGYAQSIDSVDSDGKPTYRPRTAREEVYRMKQKYGGQVDKQGKRIIDKLFPDDTNPKVPLTFAEAKDSLKAIPTASTELAAAGAPVDVPGPVTSNPANKPKP
jgi:hypothetical protein